MISLLEVLLAFLSALVLSVVCATHPTHARCPAGWWLSNGVRSDGSYVCRPLAPARWEQNVRGGWLDASEQEPGELRGRVYCSGGSRAVTADGVVVSCEARH